MEGLSLAAGKHIICRDNKGNAEGCSFCKVAYRCHQQRIYVMVEYKIHVFIQREGYLFHIYVFMVPYFMIQLI